MKKRLLVSFICLLIFALVGCSSESSSSAKKEVSKKEEKVSTTPLSKEEFTKMFSDVKKYKGSKVQFYAKIFVDPEKDDDGTYLQAYADNNQDRNIIVAIKDPNLDVKTDDIIFVSGTVKDVFKGENALGGKVEAPMIVADKIDKSDYATAFAPAIKTIDVNKEINQNGFVLSLKKIELAENESRLYVEITNKSKDTLSFYSFNSKLIVSNKQLEPADNFEANYPEIQSEILPNIKTEGVIAFPKLPESGSLKVYLEGGSENYNLEFKPFQFDIKY